MRVPWSLVTVAACLYHNYGCTRAAPARTTDEVLLGEIDIAVRNDDDSNELTIKTFEKKCIYDGKSYCDTQVVPHDAVSRCVCIDGKIYCFWNGPTRAWIERLSGIEKNNDDNEKTDSSQSTESACNDSSILSTETSDEESPPPPSSSASDNDDLTVVYKNNENEKIPNVSANDIDDENDDSISDNEEEDFMGADDETSTEENAVTSPKTNSPTTPITCLVLDRTYRVGEILPHNTGNCIECSCGPEGHVVCAPRDCVSIVPHRDYREESFQIPITGDLRGIDENF